MRKYRKYDWPKLIADFEACNQTQTQFCKDRDINARYFNQQLHKHRSHDKTKFVELEVEPQQAATSEAGLIIVVGRCKIECPTSMPLQSFTTLVHSLA